MLAVAEARPGDREANEGKRHDTSTDRTQRSLHTSFEPSDLDADVQKANRAFFGVLGHRIGST